jgi:hypothetical protein
MKVTIELKVDDQSDDDMAALCAWLEMMLRDEGHPVMRISWSD